MLRKNCVNTDCHQQVAHLFSSVNSEPLRAEIDIPLSASHCSFSSMAGCDDRVLHVESAASARSAEDHHSDSWFFWLQRGKEKDQGAKSVASKLEWLLKNPPDFDPTEHAGKMRVAGQPIQVRVLRLTLPLFTFERACERALREMMHFMTYWGNVRPEETKSALRRGKDFGAIR